MGDGCTSVYCSSVPMQSSAKVFVGGIGHDCEECDVVKYFTQFGKVMDIHGARQAGREGCPPSSPLKFKSLALRAL